MRDDLAPLFTPAGSVTSKGMSSMRCLPGPPDSITECLAGRRLYGDDFTPGQIAHWYAGEAEAYVDLAGEGVNEFGYLQWAIRYVYRHLPQRRWSHVLGSGSGRGAGLLPLRIDRCTIVESSTKPESRR